jgi:putative tryptophan/tyrosine transport system substrate-binding protein
MVRLSVAVIVATGGDPAAQAAKAATATIPIVFVSGSDPVKVGLVPRLNRPGGNITGVHLLLLGMGAKRLGLLHELVPAANPIGVLANPNFVDAKTQLSDLEDAAKSLGLELLVLKASTELEIDAAFNDLSQRRIGAVLILHDPTRSTRCADSTSCNTCDVRLARIRRSWRFDELRSKPDGWVSPGRHLHWTDSQGGEAC